MVILVALFRHRVLLSLRFTCVLHNDPLCIHSYLKWHTYQRQKDIKFRFINVGDLLCAFGTVWVAPFLVRDLILSWMFFPAKKEKRLWKVAPTILFWAILKERNRIIFENYTFSSLRLKQFVTRSPFTWASSSNVDLSFVRLLMYQSIGSLRHFCLCSFAGGFLFNPLYTSFS